MVVMMAFWIVRKTSRTFSSRGRRFAQFPRQAKCFTLQRLSVRPFTEPAGKGTDDRKLPDGMATQIGNGLKQGESAGKKAGSLILTGLKQGWEWGTKAKESSAFGQILLLVIGGLIYGSYNLWEKQNNFKNEQSEAVAEAKHRIHRIYNTATDVKQINKMLIPNWKGLKREVPLVVKGKTSIILARNQIPKPKGSATSAASDELLDLSPFDFSPFIEKVLGTGEKGFVLVDGMKGCGKTTAMMLLCSHLIQQGEAALFIRFGHVERKISQAKKHARDTLIEDPAQFTHLASHYGKRNGMTFVLDDFNQHIISSETSANDILIELWNSKVLFGARVIFTSSEYGLKKAIKNLPSHRSIRIDEVRIDPPSPEQLTKFIKEALVKKKAVGKDGNSDEDIAIYCEVIGDIRTILDGYLLSNNETISSVRDATMAALADNLEKVRGNISAVCGLDTFTESVSDFLKTICTGDIPSARPSKCDKADMMKMDVERTIPRVNRIFEQLAAQSVVYESSDPERILCTKMEQLNLVRHSANDQSRVEFHSYVEEVAIRLLLKLPAQTHENQPAGRGSEAVLSYLTARLPHLSAIQTEVQTLLHRTK